MKGKVAFVAGLATGYVLGSRAGRARYEQIKKGAIKLWETAPVVKGRKKVKAIASERARTAQNFLIGKGRQALYVMTEPKSEQDR